MKQNCKHYLLGTCKFSDDKCNNIHDEKWKKNELLKMSKIDCKYYLLGNCIRGLMCLYNHNIDIKCTPCNNQDDDNTQKKFEPNIDLEQELDAKSIIEPEPEPEPEPEIEPETNKMTKSNSKLISYENCDGKVSKKEINKLIEFDDSNKKIYIRKNYKTKLCINFEKNGTCKLGKYCNFAHGIDELIIFKRETILEKNKLIKEFTDILIKDAIMINTNYIFSDIEHSKFTLNFFDIKNIPHNMESNIVDFYNLFGEPLKDIKINDWKILSFNNTNYNFQKYNESKIFNFAINYKKKKYSIISY